MAAISIRDLYQIFGRNPSRGVRELKAGKTRAELREDGLTAAVINASLEIRPGELFVVMGLSGSGKSTLIRTVNGLLKGTAGEIRIGDESITDMSEAQLREVRRKKISMVFQNFALLPHRTVGDNAAYALKIQGVPAQERRERAEEALGMVGLDGWGDSYPHELSGGMQQRVGLARALAAGTDIMLMDEAFSALDPLIRRDMQDQLVELQSQLQKTILFITHDLNEAMRLGDRIAIMRDGEIVQIGTAEEILNDPANDYVSQFVQDVDRTRVLTAATIMERPPSVLGSEQGPKAAHKLLRESQNSWLVVVNRDRTPAGVLWEDDVADGVRAGRSDLPYSTTHPLPVVREDILISELFTESAENPTPVIVVGDDGRIAGVIPRVTLLAAAGSGQDSAPLDTVTNGSAAASTTTTGGTL